ncbi:thiamine-triphosphatase [Huso huso]|uniref:Thiamine-triphosphatase n=1 Tax=Huso huso TaxID=61971 RepID=A0ABR0Y666_HUSHU
MCARLSLSLCAVAGACVLSCQFYTACLLSEEDGECFWCLDRGMSVEVERKFVCRSDTETRLKELGAEFVGERSFHDRYFDTEQFTLTLSDTWLRCRGACWELKCPVRVREGEEEEEKGRERGGGGGGRNIKLCTRYREITELSEIVDRVRQVREGGRGRRKEREREGERGRKKEREGGWERQTDSAWLGEFALVQFASFTTVRRSYILQGGVRADLDLVDFGFTVGELEVLVETPEQIPAGAERIAELVEKLGESACNRVPGKMDAYLKQFHPEHYGRLLRAHKLHP